MERPLNRHAGIAGATGLVGTELLKQLLEDERYAEVTAYVRRPLPDRHPKLRTVVVDFDRLGEEAPDARIDDAYCCLGTTLRNAGSREAFRRVDADYVIAFAQLMQRAGAAAFVGVSAIGASPSSSVFYSRTKGEVEVAVQALQLPRPCFVRPSFLVGSRAESRPGERAGITIATVLSPFLIGPLRKYRPIHVRTVARAMIVAALTGRSGPIESDELERLGA